MFETTVEKFRPKEWKFTVETTIKFNVERIIEVETTEKKLRKIFSVFFKFFLLKTSGNRRKPGTSKCSEKGEKTVRRMKVESFDKDEFSLSSHRFVLPLKEYFVGECS